MSEPTDGRTTVTRVLVTAASRHGATAEIAERIGANLRRELAFAEVDVRAPKEVDTIHGYDVVVLGSAVYAGRWLKPARDLVGRHGVVLRTRPVWLFSSGPIGEPPKPDEDPPDAAAMMTASGAGEHRVFAGKLDRHDLGFAEKAVVIALRAPDGDFRDWAAIDAWVARIADTLRSAR